MGTAAQFNALTFTTATTGTSTLSISATTVGANAGPSATESYTLAACSLATLVSFNGSNGENPEAGLIADANGDLFGTTYQGGTSDDGTVFEITNNGTASAQSYAFSPTTLVNFNGSNGYFPGGLTAEDGDLFGTTLGGGTNDFGTVFEITNFGLFSTFSFKTSSLSFAYPDALTAEPGGGLIGTTYGMGRTFAGAVFAFYDNSMIF